MDAQTVGIVIGIIAYTVTLVAGYYKILRSVERSIRQEMKEMHAEQDIKIREAEREATEIRNNYNAKFQKVHDVVNQTKIEVIEGLHTLETNLRESHHTLTDNVTKALARLEMLFTGSQK